VNAKQRDMTEQSARSSPMGMRRTLTLTSVAALLACLSGCGHDDYYYVAPGGSSGPGGNVGYTPNSVAIADVNGDGVPDLLVATTVDQGQNQNPGFAGVYLGVTTTPGTYQAGVQYPITGTNPSGIVVVDLANAGSKDIVVSNFGNGTASVFMHSTTPGSFLAATTLTTGGQPNQVVSADINGDGFPDLVFADMNGNAIVMLQNASSPGQFEAPLNLATGGQTASVAIADVNGDGKPDIVATVFDSNGNNGQVMVFLQSATTPGTFAAGVAYPAGAQPEAVRVADVNGDGLPDLIVANQGPGTDGSGTPGVSVLLQNSATAGTFLAPVTYPTPWGPVDVAVGDLNGDGKPDLVVASLGPDPTGAVSVLLQGTTAGTFNPATVFQGYGEPLSVAIADLNGDGHPDIAVADGYNATVMLQSATSPGTFTGPTPVN